MFEVEKVGLVNKSSVLIYQVSLKHLDDLKI